MTDTVLSAIETRRRVRLRVLGVVGILFGLMTLREGGSVLFVDGAAREAAGDYVPFVLWFNFLAGFAYIAAGFGLWLSQAWAARMALGIAVVTLLMFGALGLHIAADGAYETRTVVAMTLRSAIWLVIGTIAWRALVRSRISLPPVCK